MSNQNYVKKTGRGFTQEKGAARYHQHKTTVADMQRASWLSDHLPLCVTLGLKQTAVTVK